MSRVVYTDTKDTADQEALRIAHQVRLVSSPEEGTSVSNLPGGVYGYTYSPGLTGAPLFAVRRYRSYETHKLPSGDVYVIGFAKSDVARELSTASQEMTDRKSTRLNSSHSQISYAVFCLKKKKKKENTINN